MSDHGQLAPISIRGKPASLKSRSVSHYSNVVVRNIRDREGNPLGNIAVPHDGTPKGVIAAAQKATEQMFAGFPNASNIQSRMGATDSEGTLKWSISPNFQYLAEIGTDEAHYIWTAETRSP